MVCQRVGRRTPGVPGVSVPYVDHVVVPTGGEEPPRRGPAQATHFHAVGTRQGLHLEPHGGGGGGAPEIQVVHLARLRPGREHVAAGMPGEAADPGVM